MSPIDILVAVQREKTSTYKQNLAANKNFRLQIVTTKGDALSILEDRDKHIDVLVIDDQLGGVFDFVTELRHTYPRLFIILVDEEADFGLPGKADDISTAPFENNDLARRITRLMSDRQLETLRADSLPAVRDFAKRLRKAPGESGKQQVAVSACKELGYDYVAFFRTESLNPPKITLRAQEGDHSIQTIAPKQASADDLITWVAQNGQSRIATTDDELNYPLVKRGRLNVVVCVPVAYGGNQYGIIIACSEEAQSINEEQVMMIELISAQLAAAVTKEIIR